MLIVKQDDIEANSPAPSSSSRVAPPPPFSDNPDSSSRDVFVDFDDNLGGFEEPPPYFTPYEAEYFEVGYGDVVSHDPHLNTDGEALYRFLLSQTANPPVFRLHCRGTHVETHSRWTSSTDFGHNHHHHHNSNDGYGNHHRHNHSRREVETEHVVDFDFYIDITSYINPSPLYFSISDSEPTYRGGMTRKAGSKFELKDVSRRDMKAAKKWKKQRTERGLPPWIANDELGCVVHPDKSLNTPSPGQIMRSSRTVRQWADEYCQSPKYLKEFTYEKVIYGWDTLRLTDAIRQHIIQSAPYSGTITVSFEATANKVFIRPDNRLSRTLSNKWLKFLLMMTLIYPFIWLYMRFSSSGGGKWEVCGAAYSLKQYLPPDERDEALILDVPLPASSDSARSGGVAGRVVQTPAGPKKLVGTREGEWFREWEGTIADLVRRRYKSSVPIVTSGRHAGSSQEAMLLDGY